MWHGLLVLLLIAWLSPGSPASISVEGRVMHQQLKHGPADGTVLGVLEPWSNGTLELVVVAADTTIRHAFTTDDSGRYAITLPVDRPCDQINQIRLINWTHHFEMPFSLPEQVKDPKAFMSRFKDSGPTLKEGVITDQIQCIEDVQVFNVTLQGG